jgi:hypothetical protein
MPIIARVRLETLHHYALAKELAVIVPDDFGKWSEDDKQEALHKLYALDDGEGFELVDDVREDTEGEHVFLGGAGTDAPVMVVRRDTSGFPEVFLAEEPPPPPQARPVAKVFFLDEARQGWARMWNQIDLHFPTDRARWQYVCTTTEPRVVHRFTHMGAPLATFDVPGLDGDFDRIDPVQPTQEARP